MILLFYYISKFYKIQEVFGKGENMSQIIVTSRYLKSGTETKRKNYTRYIATRETVEIREQNIIEREAPATE